ncbi:protein fem-1 homolog B-like, partial [Homalodisca vitripennis]|uniref:protein fem-1 homolog B-like n=1 Tax=Homalodisca vitripennis TaxID=197043 RepID=UPI001EEA93AF
SSRDNLRTQTQLSLKCLAAKAVQKYNIQYIGQVPHSLESFIDLHGPGEVPPVTRHELARYERESSRCDLHWTEL